MTLDECIEWHIEEYEKLKEDNPEYAGQCKQIAEWLKELQYLHNETAKLVKNIPTIKWLY